MKALSQPLRAELDKKARLVRENARGDWSFSSWINGIKHYTNHVEVVS